MGTGELSGKPYEMLGWGGGNFTIDWHPLQGGVVILLVTSCLGNWDMFQLGGP